MDSNLSPELCRILARNVDLETIEHFLRSRPKDFRDSFSSCLNQSDLQQLNMMSKTLPKNPMAQVKAKIKIDNTLNILINNLH